MDWIAAGSFARWSSRTLTGTTLTAVVFVASAVPCPSWAQVAPSAEQRRTITVSSRGEVAVAADRAIVSIAVETVHPQAETAVAENAERSARAAKAIQGFLGAEDKLTTSRYSLQPRYEHIKGEMEPRITGYVASNEVRVETAALDAVGRIVDAAIRAGANRVGSLQFTLAEREPSAQRALQLAGERARAEAETIARSLGVRIVRVLSASASQGGPIVPYRKEMMAMARADGLADTPIEAGDITIAADVHVVFEIE